MIEADVALTDFAIALACGAFVVLLARGRPGPARSAFVWLFAFTGAAALVGGIAHGFFDLDAGSPTVRVLWFATMALTGAVGAALWLTVVALAASPRVQSVARRIIIIEWLAYMAWVVWVDASFMVAIVQYALPALALLVTFGLLYIRQREAFLLIGIASLVFTFVAGALQQAAYTPMVALTHNAFFHILQLIALTGLFVTARHIDEVNRWTGGGF